MIGIFSGYLALRNISWNDVWQAFQNANWGYVGLALMCVAVGVFAKAFRWQVLMGKNGQKVSFSKLVMAHLAGQSLNMIYINLFTMVCY